MADSGKLQGKIAIVTGSSRGIGKEIALELARQGADVVVNYRSESSSLKAENVVNEIHGLGRKSLAVQADIADITQVNRLIEGALRLGDKIHIIIHNAANGEERWLKDVDEEFYNLQMNANVKGPIFLTKAALPYLAKPSRIVLTSSVSARLGVAQETVYCASKAAVEALARVWAKELGQKYGCTVNCVNPGPVDTDMWTVSALDEDFMADMNPIIQATPAEPRIGRPDDIAPLVAFLCSDEARWTTGSVLCANGGMVMT